MHPTARLVLYLFSALAVPGLSFFELASVSCVAFLLSWTRYRAIRRLIWRTRWLFLLVFLGDAFTYPGSAVVEGMGMYAPTWEGIAIGTDHALRLLTILLLLDILVLSMTKELLLAGLHGLMRPLAPLGLSPDVAAVRLGLTLEIMEQPTRKKIRLHELLSNLESDCHSQGAYVLAEPVWRGRDVGILILAALALVMLWQLG